jgi:hypothetical protein
MQNRRSGCHWPREAGRPSMPVSQPVKSGHCKCHSNDPTRALLRRLSTRSSPLKRDQERVRMSVVVWTARSRAQRSGRQAALPAGSAYTRAEPPAGPRAPGCRSTPPPTRAEPTRNPAPCPCRSAVGCSTWTRGRNPRPPWCGSTVTGCREASQPSRRTCHAKIERAISVPLARAASGHQRARAGSDHGR